MDDVRPVRPKRLRLDARLPSLNKGAPLRFPKGHPLDANYEVLEQIGEGTYAAVHKARERATGRLVAIKLLRESFQDDPDVRERFRREIVAISSIQSEHVVKLHDYGMFAGEVYLAMELIDGRSLRDVLNGFSWTSADTRIIVGQVAEALAAAHKKSILHRDLKPENVMLARASDGAQHVKVLDFGLAKLQEMDHSMTKLTQAGAIFGTAHYLAPEVIQGGAHTRQADLFALGILAYELVAFRRPWHGAKSELVMKSICTKDVPEITQLDSAVSGRRAQVNAFFQSALSRDPAERPQEAGDWFVRFDEALFGNKAAPARALSDGSEFLEVTRGTVTLPESPNKWATTPDAPTNTDEFEGVPTTQQSAVHFHSEKLTVQWLGDRGPLDGRPREVALPGVTAPSVEARSDEPRSRLGLVVAFLVIVALTAAIGFYLGTAHGPLR